MTHGTKHAPRRAAGPAAATLAALLLAGCSSGNVGESWQCPLAKGGSCDSVAAADPAVPDAAGRTVLAEPLYRVRDGGRSKALAETPCVADCGTGFDPFGWLMRLFGGAEDEDRRSLKKPGRQRQIPRWKTRRRRAMRSGRRTQRRPRRPWRR